MELQNEFILLEPFEGMPQLSSLIQSIVTAAPAARANLLTKNTYMGENINQNLVIDGTTYQTTYWQIFCAYGLIDCVNKTAAYMKGKKELPTTVKQKNDLPFEYTGLFLAVDYHHRQVVEKLLTIQNITVEVAITLITIAAQHNDWDIAKLLLAVPGVDLTERQSTALSWAVENKNLQLSKALLLAGANPTGLPYQQNFNNPSEIALFLTFDKHPVDRSHDIDLSLAKCVLKAVQHIKDSLAKSLFISATDKQIYRRAQNLLSEILDHLDNPKDQFNLIMTHLRKISKGTFGAYELTAFDSYLLTLIYDHDTLWQELNIKKPSNADPKKLPGLVLHNLIQHSDLQVATATTVPRVEPIKITILEPFSHSKNMIKLCSEILLPTPQEKLLILLSNENFLDKLSKILAGQNGITALHIFCAYGLTACAHRMIELGDNPNAIMHTSGYYTPMDLARLYNHEDTVAMLQEHGAESYDPQFFEAEEEHSHSSTDSDDSRIDNYGC